MEILKPHFDNVTELAIVCPKGQGKTTLMAALGLFHLVTYEYPDVIIAAAARDQAAKMFTMAANFVSYSPWLEKLVKVQPGYYRILRKDKNGKDSPSEGILKVVPAEPKTVDGQEGTLVLVDEYHRHSTSDLYGILRDGLPKRDGALLSISSAGDSEDSPLGRLRKRALELPNAKREGCKVTASQEDDQFAYYELSLQDNDNYEDFDLVKQANLLSIHTPESLKKRYLSASQEPWQWARFVCGLWVGGENSAYDSVAWRNCAVKNGLKEDEPCWLGVDLGWRRDSTALVPFTYDEAEDLEVVGKASIIPAPNDGSSTPTATVLTAIEAIHKRNPIEVMVLDPNAGGHFLVEEMRSDRWPELNDIKVIEHSQDPSPMSLASMALGEAIRAGKIVHPYDDGGLTEHVLAAGAKTTAGEKWRIVKQKGGRKIDAAVALAIVRSKRMEKPPKPKVSAKTYAGWKI